MSGTLYLYISSNLGIPAGTSRNFVLLPRPVPKTGHISHVPPELFRLNHSRFRQVHLSGILGSAVFGRSLGNLE